jgi:hypothetical protein
MVLEECRKKLTSPPTNLAIQAMLKVNQQLPVKKGPFLQGFELTPIISLLLLLLLLLLSSP